MTKAICQTQRVTASSVRRWDTQWVNYETLLVIINKQYYKMLNNTVHSKT